MTKSSNKKSKSNAKCTSGKRITPSMERIQKGYWGAYHLHHTALYTFLQDVCILELTYRADEKLVQQFCDDEFWNGRRSRPKPDKPQELLHYMLGFMCGDTPDASKNASLYKRAALAVMNSGVPREDIAQALKDGGGIRKMAAANKDGAEPEESAIPKEENTGRKASKSKVDEKHGEAGKSITSKAPKDKITQGIPQRRRYKMCILGIEVPDNCLSDILDHPDQSEISLLVRFDGLDDSGHKRLVYEDISL